MKREKKKSPEPSPKIHSDPFPEPRTFPKHWDLSELGSSSNSPSEARENSHTHGGQSEAREAQTVSQDPEVPVVQFPKLDSSSRTLPAKWDLSDMK